MAAPQSKQKRNIHHKYRISVINEDTFDEVRRAHLSLFNVMFFIVTTLLLSGAIVVSLIFFTPLKEYVPGYPDSETQMVLISNLERVDSLMIKVQQEQIYWDGVRQVLQGEISNGILEDTSTVRNRELIMEQVRLQATQEEMEFRTQVEQEEQYNLGLLDRAAEKKTEQTLMFPPVKGSVADRFNAKNKHFGVDINTIPKAHISAIDNGTVISVDYTLETGNTIAIQHLNNIISIYRHASSIYKVVGDRVKMGEAIGVVGNTGTLSTGEHLHFEIWKDGEAVDPESLIVF